MKVVLINDSGHFQAVLTLVCCIFILFFRTDLNGLISTKIRKIQIRLSGVYPGMFQIIPACLR